MFDEMDPRAYYDEEGIGEWERSAGEWFSAELIFEGTVEYLEAAFPAGGRVLDAGGGPARYSIWLAKRGYDPSLVDVSRRQVAIGREKIADRGVENAVDVAQGDLRDLPYPDGAFEGVCSLGGALSHVIDDDERLDALAELRRVAEPGAPVVVSVLGRIANLRRILGDGDLDETIEMFAHEARTGDYTRDLARDVLGEPDWAECHYYRRAELEGDLRDAGFEVERTAGLEWLFGQFEDEVSEASQETRERLKSLVTEFREDPTMADASGHILAVARVPE